MTQGMTGKLPQIIRRGGIGLGVGVMAAAVVALLWWANLFVGTRLALGDRLYATTPTSGDVVLVGIDDTTLAKYGPLLSWERTRYADVLDTLTDAGARVVAFDVIFAEARPGDDAFAAALERATVAGTSTVLAVSGSQRVPSDDPLLQFQGALGPVAVLGAAATHLAYVNAIPDADGTLRRASSRVQRAGDDTPRLSFPVAAYLARSRVSATLAPQVMQAGEDTLTLPPERVLPLDDDGLWLLNYYGEPGEVFPVVSFAEVADTPPETFTDKLVLVGLMDLTGAVDRYPTPMSTGGVLMPGVEIHAHTIETLIRNQPLQAQSSLGQVMTLVLVALIAGTLGGPLRWYGMLIAGALTFVGWAAYASVSFSAANLAVNALHPPLAILIAAVGNVGVRASLDVRDRQRAETLLSSLVRVSEQRLDIARIAPLVAADVSSVAGSGRGGMWTVAVDQTVSPLAQPEGVSVEAVRGLVGTAAETRTPQKTNATLAVPVIYSGRVLAVLLAVDVVRPQAAMRRLMRFAGRVAPNIENALLYEQTRRQNQLLNSILEASPAGILVLDTRLNVLRTNGAVAAWLGLSVGEMVGQRLNSVLEASSTDAAAWEAVGEGLLAGEPFRHKIKLGKQTLQLDTAVIATDGRWVLTLSDITDLAELSRVKTQMIRMASHDLKNPLGRVIGYAELLAETAEEEGHSDDYMLYTGRIRQSAQEMLKLITEILDLEHVRSGKALHEPLNLRHLVLDVVQRYTDQAEEKEQTLHQHLADDLPMFQGDYNQMVQAVSNLIGNAVKYTPQGGEITLRLAQQDGKVRIEVADTGYGMPEEAQAKLFTEFYRVRTVATQDIPGTGLGLSLVKSVIEAHGGRIWVESKLDVGSTFFVELPLQSKPVESEA